MKNKKLKMKNEKEKIKIEKKFNSPFYHSKIRLHHFFSFLIF